MLSCPLANKSYLMRTFFWAGSEFGPSLNQASKATLAFGVNQIVAFMKAFVEIFD